ncbi:IBR domain-containing protein [Seiridium cupressi]
MHTGPGANQLRHGRSFSCRADESGPKGRMANLQDGRGKHRHRRREHTRSPSPSHPHDWERTHHPTLDSLPYRTRSRAADVDIQMPDSASRRTKHSASSSHRGRRASDNLRESMPPTTTNSRRSRTVTHRRGKEPVVYEDDEESFTSRERPPRPRGRRIRTRSPSTSASERSSSRSEMGMTPPRSAHVNHSTPDSRRSSRSPSSRRGSSVDSASTVSTQNEVKEILRREPARISVIPDAEKPGHRRHHRRHRAVEPAVYEEEPSHRSRHVVSIISESREAPRRRHTHHSESRSSSRRRPHHHHDRREVAKPSSSKRGHKSYYESDSVYVDRPKLPRSSSSQVTTQTMSTSSRRSSTVISKFVFGSSSHPSKVKLVECVACLDDEIPSTKAAKLKCKHHMCHSCMKRVFKVSIKDPQHMPPKCCTEDPIPVEHVDRLFDTSFKRTWNRKFAEYSTRNRIYCPSKRCGEWIKPNRIQKLRDGRKIAKCGHCKTEVCCACNSKWHRSKDCPGDEGTNEILEQAKEYGWQRCYSCKEMVELKEGCNHMTCRCGAEFCMICGVKWKSCECPWFNYDAIEQDRLEHMNVAVDVRSERDRPPTRVSRGQSSRQRYPQAYEDEMSTRRAQERHDEDLARRLQYDDHDDDDDDDEDEFIDSYGDIIGVGNTAGHLMNDDYRRAPRVIPPAPSPPMQAVDRAGTGDYVTGVNKARGVRASSMERRLADRFSEGRQGPSPTHRSFTMPMPPPPPPPGMGMGMGIGMGMSGMSPPHPPPPPPGVPYMRRAHTMEEDMYSTPSRSRLSERITPGRVRSEYEPDTAAYTPSSRRRHKERDREREWAREQEPPPGSVLAGLTGPGSGMSRVHEWRNYVECGELDVGGIAAS